MKTAVEWFVEEMFNQGYLNDKPLTVNNIEYFVKQAKEMEKERVIDFAKKFSDFNGLTFNEKEVSKEYLEKLYEYYNETFKSE